MGAAAREIGITHCPVNLDASLSWRVATSYLSSYPGWRRILDDTKDALTPTDILRAALGVWRYQQLTRT